VPVLVIKWSRCSFERAGACLPDGLESERTLSLNEYRRKRDPAVTPEPFLAADASPRKQGRRKEPLFVVQRHDARRLHYDFRLERHGALASWAVPKGVPLEPGQKALAVHVEDHPLDYARFHGEIPQGQYGAGSVEIWDKGTYELLEEKANGQLTVALRGKRLRGTWSLVPAHLDGKEQNWLIVRVAEDFADARTSTGRRTYSPDARDRPGEHPHRRRLGLRGEVRRLPDARLPPRR